MKQVESIKIHYRNIYPIKVETHCLDNIVRHRGKTTECRNVNLMKVYGDTKTSDTDQYDQFEIRIMLMSFRDRPALALIFTDVSERNLILTLQGNDEYKNNLLASVSHELRTPLNASLNFIKMALDDPSVPKYIKEELLQPSLISNSLLLHLINDILDFSQMAANKLRLVYENKDVRTTVEQCLDLVRIQASKKGLQIFAEFDIRNSSTDFCTDHNRLKQIILNLLSNAIKFTVEGSIIVRVTVQSVDRPSEDFINMKKIVSISVEDTGIGMSQENMAKLFKAFEKIDLGNRISMNSTGAGLGLVISNNLVQMLSPGEEDNTMKVQSQPEKGTTFSFCTVERDDESSIVSKNALFQEDFNDDMNEATERSSVNDLLIRRTSIFKNNVVRQTTRNTGKFSFEELGAVTSKIDLCTCPSILIVDDDVFNITALTLILKKLDFKCDSAFNGRQAIKKVEDRQIQKKCHEKCCSQYKLIFMDCSMPIMDGFEASRILKERMVTGGLTDVPIIACTAFVQDKEKQKAQDSGMSNHVVKPLSQESVLQAIRKTNATISK